MDIKSHWEEVYKSKKSTSVSWYEPHLEKSLRFILGLGLPKETEIIDVGGGTSTLPDDLLEKGFKNITVLDISSEAIRVSKERLKEKSSLINWVEGDITQWMSETNRYDLWHDRAVFHFLSKDEDRQKYVENVRRGLKQGGYFLIATFGLSGPLKCSGLEIVRYSAESLCKELGEEFFLEKHFIENHKTPFNTTQEFLYCLFRKVK